VILVSRSGCDQARINTPGEVVWADGTGRVGISFAQMQADAARQLKEWMFVNLMVACVNYQADHLTQLYSDRSSVKQLISPVSAERLPQKRTSSSRRETYGEQRSRQLDATRARTRGSGRLYLDSDSFGCGQARK